MQTERDCADVPFRAFPAIYWKPAPPEAISACNLSVWDRWEILCFAWLNAEMEVGVFRKPKPAAA